MRTRALSDLISDVRLRTNMESSTFVTDAEITEYLNQEIAELWAHLTQGSAAPHYRSLYPISVVSGTQYYGLPADFWQSQGVEATLAGTTVALRPFMPTERAGLVNQGPWGLVDPVQYRIQAGNIEFLPATQTFDATLFYTPSSPRLVSGGDTADGFNGFEIACVYGACATVQAKEETDPSFYLAQKDRIYRHIDSLAATRDQGEPDRVQDVVSGIEARNGLGWWP